MNARNKNIRQCLPGPLGLGLGHPGQRPMSHLPRKSPLASSSSSANESPPSSPAFSPPLISAGEGKTSAAAPDGGRRGRVVQGRG